MFSEALDYLAKNYDDFNAPMTFDISTDGDRISKKYGFRREVVAKLPLASELKPNTIYSFQHYESGYHSIFHYKNGMIFNPNSSRYPLLGYEDIFQEIVFEPSHSSYNKFWEFMGMTRNNSGLMNLIQNEDNCDEWCTIAAYFYLRFEHTMIDFMEICLEEGEYKNNEWNMIHYLSIVLAYLKLSTLKHQY